MGKLPLPTESYVANAAWVERDGGIVSLFFGMRDRDSPERLKTRLEVRFPQESIVMMWRNSVEFAEKVRAFIGRLSELSRPADPDTTHWVAQKDHSLSASIAFMTQSGSHAEIDIYELPPTEVHIFQAYRNAARLTIRPVLRVYLSTHLLAKMLDQVRREAERVEPEVRRGEEGK